MATSTRAGGRPGPGLAGPSYPLQLLDRPEEPVGPEHEDQDQDHEGGDLLHPAPEDGVEVAAREVLEDADQEPADDRPRHGVETAQEGDRDHLEADSPEAHVDPAPDGPEDDPADRRDHRR